MPGSARERLDSASNIAIIILAAVMSVVLIKDYVVPRVLSPARPAESTLQIQSPVHLAGLDFSRSDRTLLFVISSECPYCRQSEDFYRFLTGTSAMYSNIQFLAVLPQPEPQGKDYVQQAGLHFSQVVSADLEQLGVAGTPTLILIDRKGNVLRYWSGKLPPEGEKKVLAAIQTP